MTEHKASRTLVKSPPELWSECSDAAALARHLGAFGEIKITRLDPEKTVAWEGETTSGTVELEPSGWGTRVTLAVHKAAAEAPATEPEAPAPPQPQPLAAAPTRAARARGALAWLKTFFLGEPEPEHAPEPAPAPEPVAQSAPSSELEQALVSALESLGQAHHRPFSRA